MARPTRLDIEGGWYHVSSNIYPETSLDVLLERIRGVVEEHGLLRPALDVITNVSRYGKHLEAPSEGTVTPSPRSSLTSAASTMSSTSITMFGGRDAMSVPAFPRWPSGSHQAAPPV